MIPAASVATSVTSASPIISAAAVDAVRCGLRRCVVASRARPAAPPNCAAGAAEHACERPHEPRGEERDADEDQKRADAHPEQDLRRAEAAPEQPVRERGEAESGQPERADRPEAGEAGLRQGRSFADGGDRRHARRPDRGPQAGEERDEDADEQRDDDRPRLEQEPLVREREADRVEELEEALREREAERRGRRSTRACRRREPRSRSSASTCRRDAPSVRIVANSRVRCAIVIESEFAITKLPTKSAMPANASRKPWRKVMN